MKNSWPSFPSSVGLMKSYKQPGFAPVLFLVSHGKTNWNAAKAHADSAHAPSNAQKNSDITKAEIEAKLTGTISTHTHNIDTIPAGSVVYMARNTAPTGFLKANGAAVSRTTYSKLYAAIGTYYGVGDGSTTFNLPDLRGEFVRSWDDGRGVDSGRAFGSAQADSFRSHQHSIVAGTDQGDGGPKGRGADNHATSGTIYTNFSGGTETRPRNVALLACIKF